jgi:hypothetical protein
MMNKFQYSIELQCAILFYKKVQHVDVSFHGLFAASYRQNNLGWSDRGKLEANLELTAASFLLG